MRMKLKVFYPLIISIFILSCANIIQVKKDPVPAVYQKKINAFGDDKEGEVILRTGEKIKTSQLKIMNDSIFIKIQETFNCQIIPLSEVNKIKYKDRIIGLGQGFYIGAGIGTFIGFSIGSGAEMGGLAILGGIITGGVLGSISGFVIGGGHEFIFGDNH